MNIENLTLDERWDILIEENICTEEELQLVTNINGYNEQTLDDVVYARVGYQTLEDYLEDIPF